MGFTVTAAELIAFLAAHGFRKETGHGRHGVKMAKGGQRIPIPAHQGDLKTNTARKILKMAGYSVDDVLDWRQR
jgi:predicted RNA binding protein YcfA (HicA-like mRNA interferase family)